VGQSSAHAAIQYTLALIGENGEKLQDGNSDAAALNKNIL
jgi:hypothetical protein